MGTAIKHHVPDRVKPPFVIFDIWALLTLNPDTLPPRMTRGLLFHFAPAPWQMDRQSAVLNVTPMLIEVIMWQQDVCVVARWLVARKKARRARQRRRKMPRAKTQLSASRAVRVVNRTPATTWPQSCLQRWRSTKMYVVHWTQASITHSVTVVCDELVVGDYVSHVKRSEAN